MAAIDVFDAAWTRADHVGAAHTFLAANTSSALLADELLRAEWAARVSALDLFIHELVSEMMLEIVSGVRAPATAFPKFHLGPDLILLGRGSPHFQSAADLAIRTRMERQTFQMPDDIANILRHVSDKELWNEVATRRGSTPQTLNNDAKAIKQQLSQIVTRRNKIVHEADLQPGVPRQPWPISASDVGVVRQFIRLVADDINAIIV